MAINQMHRNAPKCTNVPSQAKDPSPMVLHDRLVDRARRSEHDFWRSAVSAGDCRMLTLLLTPRMRLSIFKDTSVSVDSRIISSLAMQDSSTFVTLRNRGTKSTELVTLPERASCSSRKAVDARAIPLGLEKSVEAMALPIRQISSETCA
jgi:hypothetical protein